MVRRKRSDRKSDDGTSTDSSEDYSNTVKHSGSESCGHVQKAINSTLIRNTISSKGLELNCSECKGSISHEMQSDVIQKNTPLWLCLMCGMQFCGRKNNSHALYHYNTARSVAHSVAMNTTTFDIWCYQCEYNINPKSKPHLLELVEFIKHKAQKTENSGLLSKIDDIDIKIRSSAEDLRNNVTVEIATYENIDNIRKCNMRLDFGDKLITDKKEMPKVRGLANLGNTCFFNAVLQCLAKTPYLLHVLKESSKEGEELKLFGGTMSHNDGTKTLLPPINGELKAWGNLTEAFAETLEELQLGTAGTLVPRKLLTQLTSKWPQFDGGDQHDSHELLRHLLESVRTEDLRRYQTVILYSMGYSRKVNPQTVEDDIKSKIKFYSEQVSERILRPEQVFRGSLVSTLTCQDCRYTSSRHEYFLDISLPVCTEKPQPPIRRKGSPEPEYNLNTSSSIKAPNKKERERDRRIKRAVKHQKTRINLSSIGYGSSVLETDPTEKYGLSGAEMTSESNRIISSSCDSNDPSDADIEDNDITDQNGNQTLRPEKIDDIPEKFDKETDGNVVISMGLSACGVASMVKKMNLNNMDGNKHIKSDGIDNRKASPTSSKRQRTFSYADWSNTVAPRYQCEEGEYSIQSCFNSFTALELMTGNNKVCCEACTEKINGKDGKSVNTNATKQFLISIPPAVLILHLKRFQVSQKGVFKKITIPVSFPFVLDIAPFCGSKVKRASHIRPGQNKILYALYGIVEHSGSMHGGHYVAYVKVRDTFATNDDRWKFIPQGSKDELDRKSEDEMAKEQARRMGEQLFRDSDDSNSNASIEQHYYDYNYCASDTLHEEGAVGYTIKTDILSDIEPPTGKWYYVSDSHVREASEETVLKAQAYLLFYERFF